ncbi:hypothetical protein A2303_03175 [Candidatus Falkowbacteria bacterium RIFOXYB2_FULL_47_14]|uniref:Uncharacterized protein n=1 Tax=Candidatus Falkowbacteria bacterium RIFOXYA2_FULL_47_19 TaxID=1797994 RepID=A0A1F5SF16_9BACT|nr:MAG: hypothetical protein A2227_07800 [Candidatus Falkowbacteria bacterium RIFOXYA2_FULL_47_19]OGF35188.1 MAG: hypothetical protein A2468_02010 [Candidatus Falkowbacteria bacterium RIFOXYC2_FULL_46_15]OGF43353.1 MAG: hypothetical protein A2303_03175 [Candidatus Falkowbacteria bacterium RIFOXYB2_FULL_47_14]
MKEKRLKLNGYCELIGELKIVFHETDTPFVGEQKLTDLLENEKKIFSVDVWGRLWTPENGGGPYGNCCNLCSIVFHKKSPKLVQRLAWRAINIFIPEFFSLLFRELEKFVAENWGEVELEKKQALLTWIEKEKRHLAGIETYNKIRGRLDNCREKNLANPKIVAALNDLARALGILPERICLYGRPRDEEYQKAKKSLNLAGVRHEESYGIKLELWVEGRGYRGLEQILEYAENCPSIRIIA